LVVPDFNLIGPGSLTINGKEKPPEAGFAIGGVIGVIY
jgi:hypothetical protein